MGLFDKFKKNKDKSSFDLKKFEEQCKVILGEFEKNGPIKKIEIENGTTLDFSEKSIDILPLLIDEIKNAKELGKISAEYFDTCINVLGWYLGTTILENGLAKLGAKWNVSNSIPGYEGKNLVYIESKNGMMHFPIAKVEKYALEGKNEDIKAFYNNCFELSK